jgi:hypothetical protein
MDSSNSGQSFGAAIDRQLRSWEIQPASFDAMAKIFSRNLARAFDRASRELAGHPERIGWERVEWLDPATVWWVLRGSRMGRPFPDPPALSRFREERPAATTCVVGHGPDSWASDVVARLGSDLDGLEYGVAEPTVSSSLKELDVLGRLREAEWRLESSWPEERRLVGCLIRSLICVDGGLLRSGSDVLAFGAIFVNPRKVRSTIDLLEVLLHETAHHELFLRNVFAPYLRNPRALAYHSLRTDPRPMEGVLHAAVALGRMVMGLQKVAETEHSREVESRVSCCRTRFKSTMKALDAAEWTVEGKAFYDSMREWAA